MTIKNHNMKLAKDVLAGERICQGSSTSDYTVDKVEQTAIGMVRFQHAGGSAAYWPYEWVYVENRKV